MLQTTDLAQYLEEFLNVRAFKDYCHNGLQLQGKHSITKIVSGVSANLELIDAAIASNADAILVHHGLFWKGDELQLVEPIRGRVKSLLENDINLLAYHLPLDCHLDIGNNAGMGKLLEVQDVQSVHIDNIPNLLWHGTIETCSGLEFANLLQRKLGQKPIHINSSKTDKITKISWCTGAAQDYILNAKALGVDAFITGEISERTVHLAKELEVDFFAAGHHATEKSGIKNLGEHLARQFSLEHIFIDILNPV